MMLFIVTVSHHCSVDRMIDAKKLFEIQSLYIFSFWRYLVYLYGFDQAGAPILCLV